MLCRKAFVVAEPWKPRAGSNLRFARAAIDCFHTKLRLVYNFLAGTLFRYLHL